VEEILINSIRTGRSQSVRSRLQYSILFPKSPSAQRRQDVVPRSDPFHLYSRLFRVRPHILSWLRDSADDRFTWITFIAVAAVVGRAVSFSNDPETLTTGTERYGVGIYWGQSPWLILGSAVVHFGWVYEAVRWRVSLM
jgi:hypothetical protein